VSVGPPQAQQIELGFLLQPAAVYPAEGPATACAVASLTIGCPPPTGSKPTDAPSQLELLVATVGSWLLRSYTSDNSWQSVLSALGTGRVPPTNWHQDVVGFLVREIDFVLRPLDPALASEQIAFFPMFGDLILSHDGRTIVFADQALTPDGYPETVAEYFAALSPGYDEPVAETRRAAAGRPLADYLLDDYLLAMARNLARESASSGSLAVLAAIRQLNSHHLSGRLRLPDPAGVPSSDPALLRTASVYALTGQQFDVGSTDVSASLAIRSNPGPLAACLSFLDGAESITASMPATAPPPAPAPDWGGPGDDRAITVSAVPAGEAVPIIEPITTRLRWQRPGGDGFVAPLPAAVLRRTATQPLRLTVTAGDDRLTVRPALLIPITVHLVERNSDEASGSPYTPCVYRVAAVDDEIRDRMATALAGPDRGELHVLYDAPDGGYRSDEGSSHLLVRTDLADSGPGRPDLLTPASAPLTTASAFLSLLLQASGARSPDLYLHYRNAAGTGLPAEIFGPTGDSADLVLALLCDAGSDLASWHNGFIADANPPSSPELRLATPDGIPIREFRPAYPPGWVGFGVQFGPDDEDWANQPYRLVQFRLAGNRQGTEPPFGSSPWSRPLRPPHDAQTEDNSAPTYRQLVPAHRFLAETAQRTQPYAAVGGSPSLTLRLLDGYGNALDGAGYDVSIDVRYNDPLWSPAEWPGVRIGYRFGTGAAGPVLLLNLRFDPAAALRDGPAAVALRHYALITGQLADPNTSAVLTCTMLPSLTHSTGLTASFLDFARQAAAELAGSGEPRPQSATIEVPIRPGELADATWDLLPLRVILELSRPPALVFTDGEATVPRSQSNRAMLTPELGSPSELAGFAADFHRMFAGFDKVGAHSVPGAARLAVRSDGADLTAPDALWVIRWSETAGVDVSVPAGPAAYFASAPLGITLASGSAEIPSYGNDPLGPTYASRSFAGIDLDGWAQSFLLAFDEVLAPASATAIAAADPTRYAELMLAKRVLAECLAAGVVPVYAPAAVGTSAGDLAAARHHLERQALGSLSSAYATSAIVQVPAVTSSVGRDRVADTASLLGELTLDESVDRLSDAMLPPTGQGRPGHLTFSISVADLSAAAQVRLRPRWHLRSVERLLDVAGDYRTVQRLQVLPGLDLPGLELGTLTVPVPQRRFPAGPVLFGQVASQSSPVPAVGSSPLVPYLRWDYQASLSLPEPTAQDLLWLNVTYNAPGSQPGTVLGAAEPSLFQALASFTAGWPQLQAWLAGLVAGQPQPVPEAVIEAYLRQLKPVARAWARTANVADPWADQPATVSATEASPADNQQVDSYQISFEDVFAEQPALVVYARARLDEAGGCAESELIWPVINGQPPGSISAVCRPAGASCAGAPTSEPCWYRAVYSFTRPDRSAPLELVWRQLDALTRQTAQLGCWVSRNSRMAGEIPVNPAFCYGTPPVGFENPVTPVITVPPLGPVPAQDSLSATLSQALAPLARLGTAVTSSRLVQIALGYSYELADPAGVRAREPILLVDQIRLIPEGTGGEGMTLAQLCDELAANCRRWFDSRDPLTDGAMLTASVVLSAEIAGSQLPMVRVEQLDLTVPPGWWP
jgi:hypothetical protein